MSGAAVGAMVLGEPTAGATIGAAGGAALQAGAEDAVKYLFDLGAELASDWKPVVFGDWYRANIKVIEGRFVVSPT